MATIQDAVRRVPGASDDDMTAVLAALAAKRFTGSLPAAGSFQHLSTADLKDRFGLDVTQVALVKCAQMATASKTPARMNFDDFKRMCGVQQLSTRDTMALLDHAPARYALDSGCMTPDMAVHYLALIRGRVQTATREAIMRNENLILDTDIMAQGQSKSALHFAYRDARVVCAKVYNYTSDVRGGKAAARTESQVSRAVHGSFTCPTLIQVELLIETSRHGILVLPLMGRDCSELFKFDLPQPMLDSCAGTICMSVLSAIAGLAMLGWCHGDVKPHNIMLPTHKDGHVTLIDLASCTLYGEYLTEITASYAMDPLAELQPCKASLKWDLVCTAATIYTCGGAPVPAMRWEQLREELSSAQPQEPVPLYLQLCRTILCNVDASVQELEARVWQPCLKLVEQQLGSDVAGVLQRTWPLRRSGEE